MFYSSLKRTLMVCMGILCFFGNPSEKLFAATSLTVFLVEACQLLYEADEVNPSFDIPIGELVETSLIGDSEFLHDSNEIIITRSIDT